MTTTQADILVHRQKGLWKKLERIAADIVADAEKTAGSQLHPLLGGGTRVMLALNHRISNDIDLFIRDPIQSAQTSCLSRTLCTGRSVGSRSIGL